MPATDLPNHPESDGAYGRPPIEPDDYWDNVPLDEALEGSEEVKLAPGPGWKHGTTPCACIKQGLDNYKCVECERLSAEVERLKTLSYQLVAKCCGPCGRCDDGYFWGCSVARLRKQALEGEV